MQYKMSRIAAQYRQKCEAMHEKFSEKLDQVHTAYQKMAKRCQMMEQEIESLAKDKQELQEKQKRKLDEMYDQLRSEYQSVKRSAIQPANNFFARNEPDLFSNPTANMMDNRDPIRKDWSVFSPGTPVHREDVWPARQNSSNSAPFDISSGSPAKQADIPVRRGAGAHPAFGNSAANPSMTLRNLIISPIKRPQLSRLDFPDHRLSRVTQMKCGHYRLQHYMRSIELNVKLHDMVRDVALWIASKEDSGFMIKSRVQLLNGSLEPSRGVVLTGCKLEREKDILLEIHFLTKLKILYIGVSSFHLPEDHFEFPRLERFDILINFCSRNTDGFLRKERSLRIKKACPLNLVSLLLENIESLEVEFLEDECIECLSDKKQKKVSVTMILQNLKQVWIVDCSILEVSVFSVSLDRSLAVLENLEVACCVNLRQIVTGLECHEEEISLSINTPHSLCFPKLTKLRVGNCDRLEYIFPTSMASQGLPQLEILVMYGCPLLKQVVRPMDGRTENDIVLLQLSKQLMEFSVTGILKCVSMKDLAFSIPEFKSSPSRAT
ncbi:E3 ubiquitin-protein ligase CCNB1IP1-like protein [Hibiscus syriacus]|uniref:E3 ubiquitin-protein ligase CCNB1IP1-like protein n=1 Tax=Hibiscus syriacus TaxID=106335 RepID=A0A6A2YWC6_HIBSY|nr:E3 ubiquitin-protein ligase CCNB1IP1-like protein [Hibiscus syriacus]